MHILLVTATYLPSINGVSLAVAALKEGLESRGHQVTVLAPANKKATKEKGVLRYPSFPNPFNPDYPAPLLPGIATIYQLLRGVKPDLIHTHHPYHVGSLAKALSRYYRVPLVFTYHTQYDLYAQKYLSFLPRLLQNRLTTEPVNDFMQKTDLVIAPSRFIARRIVRSAKKAAIRTIPSPVWGLEKLPKGKAALRRELGLPARQTILLTVSRLGPEKDVDKLIKMMDFLPSSYALAVVGAGPQEKILRKLARDLTLDNRIIFYGRVPHEKVGKYYQLADLFVYASKTETQGLIFLEALTFGLPIVTAASEAAREWVKKDFGMLVKDTSEALAQGVLTIKEKNSALLSRKARAYAAQFSSAALLDKVISSYQEAIKIKSRE